MVLFQVNLNRLSDGESRVLQDQDMIYLTFAAFDARTRAVYGSLRLQYRQHCLPDISAALSSTGRAARRALDEFDRIRQVVEGARSVKSFWRLISSLTPTGGRRRKDRGPSVAVVSESARTYRGALDRPGRVQTPVLLPPPPFDYSFPEITAGRHSVNPRFSLDKGMRRDDPDVIWGSSIVHFYSSGHRFVVNP